MIAKTIPASHNVDSVEVPKDRDTTWATPNIRTRSNNNSTRLALRSFRHKQPSKQAWDRSGLIVPDSTMTWAHFADNGCRRVLASEADLDIE